MADIATKVAQIREAIYGKDVRENIASGIEAINAEVESTTGRQNVIDSQEQTRINNETTRQSNESSRQSTFITNENAREKVFQDNEDIRESSETTRVNNETIRVSTFDQIKDDFANMQHSDATLEVIQARGGKDNLNLRLNDMASVSTATNEVVSGNTSKITEITTNYNVYASTKVGDYYTVVDYKRVDDTLYLKSTLSNANTNGYYQTCTLDFYDDLGTTITKITVWTLTYDVDGNIIAKVVS